MTRVTTRLLGRLSRLSAAHPWSHNVAYSPWIIRHARAVRRRGGARALDIGCGTGLLLKRLARIMPEALGIEPDEETAARARATIAGVNNAAVLQATFDPTAFAPATFDLVTLVASLHHLPLGPTLESARSLLRPGGRLVIVGLAREEPTDLPWSVTSLLLNPVIGLIRHPRRTTGVPASMTAPTSKPEQSFEQIRATTRNLLPGVKMRRGLFWRYTAVWTARS